jgi:hypothetical protein
MREVVYAFIVYEHFVCRELEILPDSIRRIFVTPYHVGNISPPQSYI